MPTTPAAFLVPDDALPGAAPGSLVTLTGEEGRHAARVARIGTGERVLLLDAPGRRVLAEVVAARREELDLRLLAEPDPPRVRRPRLTLVQALAAGGRDEQAVEAATELGVDRVVPWSADRSVVRWKGDRLVKGRRRWEATVRAAVKQCRRAGVPVVEAPVSTAALAEEVRARVTGGGIALVLHEQEAVSIVHLAGRLGRAAADGVDEVLVVVGPEGGISEHELDLLRGAGAVPVLLGPEVLRSSTAGPAALAVLSAVIGRWGEGRGEGTDDGEAPDAAALRR